MGELENPLAFSRPENGTLVSSTGCKTISVPRVGDRVYGILVSFELSNVFAFVVCVVVVTGRVAVIVIVIVVIVGASIDQDAFSGAYGEF